MVQINFTAEHEWIRLDGREGTIGISNYAQQQLGDVVFVELPEIGRKVEKGAEIAVVESVKVASGIYAPVTGEVIAVNEALTQNPALINTDPMGEGWVLRLQLAKLAELEVLMDLAAYDSYILALG